MQDFKNFNNFSVSLIFHHDEVEDPIYGADEEEQLDWLDSEAHFYKYNSIDVEYYVGQATNDVEILKDEIEFLIKF